jgi:sugar lactone lactonase YvrE
MKKNSCLARFIAFAALVAAPASAAPFISTFHRIHTVSSTVPHNGDVNPYGVAVVQQSVGRLHAGNILVSNFNDSQNLQGLGTTIVQIPPHGQMSLFTQFDARSLPGPCPGGVGLTTALVVLSSGWVIVGSLPTSDGSSATMQAGCLLVVNSDGRVVQTISGGVINGPWDMTALDQGDSALLFVTNVLNGTVAANGRVVNRGTVVRIALSVDSDGVSELSRTVIGTGFGERTDPSSLVVGPTGVGLGEDGTLFVADSVSSRIVAIDDAVWRDGPTHGMVVSSGGALNDPLGLAIAPNGDILTTNGGDGNLVETTPDGHQVAVQTLDDTPAPPGPPGNGTLFGLAIVPGGSGVYFVDDGSNTLNLLH